MRSDKVETVPGIFATATSVDSNEYPAAVEDVVNFKVLPLKPLIAVRGTA